MPPCRYAVFGLLDASASEIVRPLQQWLTSVTGNDLSMRFPVHVTLRGRFWAEPDSVTNVLRGLDLERPAVVHFRVPVFRDPDMLWLSVDSSKPGFDCLFRLHVLLTEMLGKVVVREETLPAHTGPGYSPHVTLTWGATRETHRVLSPEYQRLTIEATLAKVVLVEYPSTWPASGVVAPVTTLTREEAGSSQPPQPGADV